ncbi:MAG: hypothetical protein H6621_13075 [Halobacteriovoraceae bacterium]|nr:hypothetical protein [Halobacteriovoraceae bacterium]
MLRLITIALFSIVSSSLWALEIGDHLPFRIVRVLPQNVIAIDKGQVDMVNPEEQVKMYHGDQFVSRALCIRSDKNMSFWKLYRVVKPSKFLETKGFQLKAIPLKDVPWEYIKKPLEEYQKITEEFYPPVKNYSTQELLNESIREVQTTIFASPFRIESINNHSNLHYGIAVDTKGDRKYLTHFMYEGYQFQATDVITNESFQQTRNKAEVFLTNTRLLEDNKNVFFGADYFTQKQGEYYPYRFQIRVYPFGIEKNIKINDAIPKLSFVYAPILESYSMEKLNTVTSIEEEKNDSAIRHLFGFNILVNPLPKLEIVDSFKLRPEHETENIIKLDFEDIDFENTFTIRYLADQSIHFDYTNVYSIDRRRELYTNLEEGNIIHSFNINFNFSM